MKTKILIITLAFLLVSVNGLFAQRITREEIVSDIQKILTDIYTVEAAYYNEFNRYTDKLEELGIDLEVFSNYWPDYWDVKFYLQEDGFVVEGVGVTSPVLGEIWDIDSRNGVVRNLSGH
ncbi:MAG: hypothetical protein ACE5IH_07290 [Thermodesulfobacteriota bacterium]